MSSTLSNIKCIAFDLDFTILNSDKTLSPRLAAALAKAAEKGIVLVPVSGRAFHTFPACLKDLPGISYAVSSNGAAVYDTNTGERIHEALLSAVDVRRIMRSVSPYFLEGQIAYEAFLNGEAYAAVDYVNNPAAFGIYPGGVAYIKSSRKPVRYIIDFIFEHAKELESVDFILKNTGLFSMIAAGIKRSAENITITSSVPFRLEVMSSAAGKDNGLSFVLDRLGIAPEEVLAFGDGDNDIPMLQLAGMGVALKNGTQQCRDAADAVTEGTVDEDGVAAFLESFVL